MINYKNSTFLVTGGAGFIGSHICEELARKEAKKIIVLDNYVRGRYENVEHLAAFNFEAVRGDIRDKELVEKYVLESNYVFHQAALRLNICEDDPSEAYDTMVKGTHNVLNACYRQNIKKIVLASSASVYINTNEEMNEETSRVGAQTIYGTCKYMNELQAEYFFNRGLPFVALRYFNVYGPRMDRFGAYTEVLIKWLCSLFKTKETLIVHDKFLDFVYVKDIVDANMKALESDAVGVFNVGTGEPASLEVLATLLAEASGTDDYMIKCCKEKGHHLADIRKASTKLAKEKLGFEAKTELEDGLKELINWFKKER